MNEKSDLAKTLEDLEKMGEGLAWLKVFLDDVAGDNDRSAAITLATLVDDQLGHAIEARLVPLSNTIRDSLYTEGGPLESFSAKINFGFALGLYGKQTRADLHLVRRVRNQFAHFFAINSFEHEEISKLCKNLKTPDFISEAMGEATLNMPELKAKYFITTMLVVFNLRDLHGSIESVSAVEGTLP